VKVFVFFSLCKVMVMYDTNLCRAYIASHVFSGDAANLSSECEKFQLVCACSEILFKENRLTVYPPLEAEKALLRVTDSALFGRFDVSDVSANMSAAMRALVRKYGSVVELVRMAFCNRGRTGWKLKSGQFGAVRLYPSNGAIHALRPKVVSSKGSFEYFPHSDYFTECVDPKEDRSTYLEIVLDLDRILEKYRDVGALAAIYIELGHLVAVILSYCNLSVSRILMTKLSPCGRANSFTLARIYYGAPCSRR